MNSNSPPTPSNELVGIRELLAKATPGPWQADDLSVMGCRSVIRGDDLIASVEDALSTANAELIALAPTMADTILRLEAEIAELREALDDLMGAVMRDADDEFGIGGLTTIALLRAHRARASLSGEQSDG